MLRSLITILLCGITLVAIADNHQQANVSAKDSKQTAKAYLKQHQDDGKQAAQSTLEKWQAYKAQHDNAGQAAKQSKAAAQQAMSKRQKRIQQQGRIVGGIADKHIAAKKAAMRKALGLEKEDQLYIFVSRSMPANMIRSYALSALYAGGVLVTRGLPKGKTMNDYVHSQFVKRLRPDGHGGASIEIDPRLFDAFQVDTVPSIVYTDSRLPTLCHGGTNTHCPPVDSDSYVKMAGSVTLKYALDQFIQHGFGGAKRFQQALAKGYRLGKPDKPNRMKGLDDDGYLAKLLAFIKKHQDNKNNKDVPMVPGTDKAKTTLKNTPFGAQEMPVNESLYLEATGDVTPLYLGGEQQ